MSEPTKIQNHPFWQIFIIWAVIGSFFLALEFIARHFQFARNNPRNWYLLDDDLGFKTYQESHHFTKNNKEAEILMVGDSILYNPLREGFSATPRLINRGHRVIELSAGNYGTTQEWVLVKRHQKKLPRLKTVILNFCLFNDFLDNAPPENPRDIIPPRPYYELTQGKLQFHYEHINYQAKDYI